VGIWDQLQKLEQEAEGRMLVIPQGDGTVKKFPSGAGIDACTNFMERLGAGEDAPPPSTRSLRQSEELQRPEVAALVLRRGGSLRVGKASTRPLRTLSAARSPSKGPGYWESLGYVKPQMKSERRT
jgi:hypothetical protein